MVKREHMCSAHCYLPTDTHCLHNAPPLPPPPPLTLLLLCVQGALAYALSAATDLQTVEAILVAMIQVRRAHCCRLRP